MGLVYKKLVTEFLGVPSGSPLCQLLQASENLIEEQVN
jgi:hypothetical protein